MIPKTGAQRQRKHRRKKNQAAKPPAQTDGQSQRRQRMANGGHLFRPEEKTNWTFRNLQCFFAQESTT